ncbi:MAG TPA: ParB/RepB/Spo0J family partition protein, partial [Myxococcota bacterium]|nr:ParB/RepB/Spo0J family partition protein [Myxococcota bacterium]
LIGKILIPLYKGAMNMIAKQPITIEHHCLQMKYAHLRTLNRQSLEKLMISMERHGQLKPVVVVPEAINQWVLIDGYHRVQALKLLGKDTIEAEVWDCDVTEALIMMLKNRSHRPFGILEEALFLHELYSQHGLSQEDLATRTGRDQSWISRRLSLVAHLPESIRLALSQGSVSLWVCVRVLAPMARAIPDHAQRLLGHLLKNAYSTRDMQFFYDHYQKSNHQARSRMLDDPALFFKAHKLLATEKQAAALRKGPEGEWRRQCQTLMATLSALNILAPGVFYRQTAEACRQSLEEWKDVTDKLTELTQIIEGFTNADHISTPNDSLPLPEREELP